jgi:transcriptional regulator with XRE-family HTH domain
MWLVCGERLAEVEPIHSSAVDARSVGRRIAQARHEAGWMTQKTLAELLCVCKRSVQAYESGTTIPYRHLHRLAQIFERPSSWFLYGDQPRGTNSREDQDGEIVKHLDAQTRLLKALAVEVRDVRNTLSALDSRSTEPDDRLTS